MIISVEANGYQVQFEGDVPTHVWKLAVGRRGARRTPIKVLVWRRGSPMGPKAAEAVKAARRVLAPTQKELAR